MAYEKKSKMAVFAEQLIDQRNRCKTYLEIAEEEEKQNSLSKKKREYKHSDKIFKQILRKTDNSKTHRTFKQRRGLDSDN
jgi:hypothetical protein